MMVDADLHRAAEEIRRSGLPTCSEPRRAVGERAGQ
jgi:hypothetical protein